MTSRGAMARRITDQATTAHRRGRPSGITSVSRAGAALLLAVAGSFGAMPAVVSAASAPDADIPGIALPGPVVTGQLGGPIYDHVYQVDVPPGNVLLVSMTGDPGTDFDLYLFDSTATTILADPPVGLVATSRGPTATESISYPSRAGGRYFLDLNGASDVEGAFRLSVALLADATPPTVSLRIQGGSAAVSDPTVTLTIVAADTLSGVDVISFSTDGVAWMPWQPYVPSMLWTFTAGDGPKQLWVRARDRAGNVSPAAWASTALDTVAPTITSVEPAANAEVDSLRPVVSVTFSKSVAPLGWKVGGVSVSPSAGGPDVPGTFSYDDASRTGTFTPTADLVAGSPYAVRMNPLYDLAGNALTPYAAWTFTPKQPVPLRLSVTPPAIISGTSAALLGVASPPSPMAIEIQALSSGTTAWSTIAAQFPDASGQLRFTVGPPGTTAYRLHVAGSGTTADSVSPVATLAVRTRITLAGLVPGGSVAHAGTVQPLLAQLRPAVGGTLVTFRIYHYDTAKRAWRPYTSVTRTSNADGLATWRWTQRTGLWYLRVTTAQTAANAAGISAVYKWTVR